MAVRLRREDGPDLIIEATLREVAGALNAAFKAGQTLKIETPEGTTLEVDPEQVTAVEATPPHEEGAEATPAEAAAAAAG